MRDLLVSAHLTVFAVSSIVMLYQAYTHALPTIAYYLALALFISAVASSINFGSKLLAGTGVFSFYLVIRLMFYVSTRFLVFPFNDSYAQFGIVEAFAQSSHAQILNPTVHILDLTTYLATITNQYSQWPGLEILTLMLANVTGLPLLTTALALTMTLDVGWFAVAYCLIGKILNRVSVNLPNPVALCLGIVTSLPVTVPLPTYFKYDFLAMILMLAGILLLVRIYDDLDNRVAIPLIVISAAITITHSITAFVWILILLSFVIWNAVMRPLAKFLPSMLRYLFTDRARRVSPEGLYASVKSLFIFVLVSTVSYWTFYAPFMKKLLSVSSPRIFATFSPSFALQAQRLSPSQGLGLLTPPWILELLSLRDRVFLGLLLAGIVTILLGYSIVKRAHLRVLLLTVATIAPVTALSHGLSYGDRAFTLLGPLIGILLLAPLILVGLRRALLGKMMAISITVLLMLSVGLGFWASSYAPTGLYTYGADPSSASGRPLSWPAVASYMSFSGNEHCILTNEIYVTSLSVPVSEWNITKIIGVVRIEPGCLAIVYNGLYSTVNANISSFGFTEPYIPYAGFSPRVFYDGLGTNSDRVFDSGEETTYFYL